MSNKKNRIIWVDCEMTGLDSDVHHLVEVACVITEGNETLDVVAKGPNIIIHQSEEVLAGMSDWCVQHFAENGLTAAIRASRVSLAEAESRLLAFVQAETPAGVCPLGGNSVGEDKRFLLRHMPRLAAHLHHRIVDVSTVKELCRRWYPKEFAAKPKKNLSHRALDDILESIEELKYYQKHVFK